MGNVLRQIALALSRRPCKLNCMQVRCRVGSLVVPIALAVIQACSTNQRAGDESSTGGSTGYGTAGNSSRVTGSMSSASQEGVAHTTRVSDASGGADGTPSTGGANTTQATSSNGGATVAGGAKGTAPGSATGGAKNITSVGPAGGSTSSTASGGNTGGTKAVDGTNTSLCGTAAEDEGATLSCPKGQIIDSIVFASYGTPTGTCGSFAAGDCNAATSRAQVQSLCVGQNTCSVQASNATFGDPCRSTTKRLSIEATCVEGTAPEKPQVPYKGVANSPAKEIASLGATWCYNWGTTPKTSDCDDPNFVPMVWGSGDVAGAIKAIGDAGYTTVLGFNEPNKSDQANMTVAAALALWPAMTSDPNIRVGSPAVSDDGRSWLENFMTQANASGLRVDFIAMHWYGWNAGSCVASQLEGAVKWASKWGLPIWITEFGCMGSSNTDEQTVIKFFNDAIAMLAKYPLVERYAWYPWNTYNHLYEDGTMTSLGKAFTAAPQYRQ